MDVICNLTGVPVRRETVRHCWRTEPITGSHQGAAELILKATRMPVTTALPSEIVMGTLRNFCIKASVTTAATTP